MKNKGEREREREEERNRTGLIDWLIIGFIWKYQEGRKGKKGKGEEKDK